MEVSDSASHYVDVVGDNYVSGGALSLAGGLLLVGGLMAVQGWRDEGQKLAGAGASVAGLTLFAIGNRRAARARDAMQSAIWWYNAGLADPLTAEVPDGDARGRAPPSPIASTHARAGTAVGLVGGALGGLAATSGLDSSETAEGLSLTIALTAIGALVGHHVGKAIER